MAKFYSVRKGRKVGIYETWDECKEQILKFKGAQYKSFKTYNEAIQYLNFNELNNPLISNTLELDDKTAHLYTDGSYLTEYPTYFTGGIVEVSSKGKYSYYCKYSSEWSQYRNVAGELCAVMAYFQNYIKKENMNIFRKIIIFHDYYGVANWLKEFESDYVIFGSDVHKHWKANNDLTIKYKEYMKSVFDALEIMDTSIEFRHVKGHSGNKYNDEADNIASSVMKDNYSFGFGIFKQEGDYICRV